MTVCVRCRIDRPKHLNWPDGPVCLWCGTRARRRRGCCAGCNEDRVLPGNGPDGSLLCVDCAGMTLSLRCQECGVEDNLHERGRCPRCVLRSRIGELLQVAPDGDPTAPLRPLFDALVGMTRPLSGLQWLRNERARALLAALGRDEISLSHQAFDELPPSRTVEYVRELLVTHRLLPCRNRDLARMERWVADKLATIGHLDDRQTIQAFVRWHHLRRLRDKQATGELGRGAVRNAKQQTTVATQFLAWIGERDITLDACRQGNLEEWLVTGPGTRRMVEGFLLWATRQGCIHGVKMPPAKRGSLLALTQERRIELVRMLLTDDQLDPGDRVIGSLLLLYAQPVSRITQLKVDGDCGQPAFGVAVPRRHAGRPHPRGDRTATTPPPGHRGPCRPQCDPGAAGPSGSRCRARRHARLQGIHHAQTGRGGRHRLGELCGDQGRAGRDVDLQRLTVAATGHSGTPQGYLVDCLAATRSW
jgi:hypothetical protein